jgi:hypothetical protein
LKALEQRGELSGSEWEALIKELELATKEEAKAVEAYRASSAAMSNGRQAHKHTHAQQQAVKAQAALKALEEDGKSSGNEEQEALTKELELETKAMAEAAEAWASACSRGVRGTKPGTKRSTYQLKDPNAPRRPYGPTRWFSYLNRKRVKKSNPGKDSQPWKGFPGDQSTLGWGV